MAGELMTLEVWRGDWDIPSVDSDCLAALVTNNSFQLSTKVDWIDLSCFVALITRCFSFYPDLCCNGGNNRI